MSQLNQIQTFIQVAESCSFSAAARRLALPRSTVSARVKALEGRLSTRLLNRNTRNVTLTQEGELYLQHCQQTLAQLLAVEDALAAASSLSGTIKITVPVDLPKLTLAKILSEFSGLHLDIKIQVLVSDTPEDLVAKNIDLAIRGKAPGDQDLIARQLAEGEMAYYAHPRFTGELASSRIFDPGAIAQNTADTSPIISRNFELAKGLAMAEQGIALLPKNLVNPGELSLVPCGEVLPKLPLYIVYPSRIHLPVRVRKFIDFLLASQSKYPLI